jgi:N-acetylneuraminic acid mutarotase
MISCRHLKLKETASERYRHTANVYQNSMYLFGGKENNEDEDILSNASSITNSIDKYDFEKKIWSELQTEGDIPKHRAGHTSVIYKNSLYVFGGIFTNFFPLGNYMNQKPELYQYDFNESIWDIEDYNGNVIDLFGHTAVVYQDEMILYGGGRND